MEKNPVRLRKKKISGGVESLYLDIYDRGKRKYEFLGLYLHPGDRKYAVSDRNTMKAVEVIIARRTLEVINRKAGIQTESMMTVLDYMKALAAKKNASKTFRLLVPFIERHKPDTRLTAVDKNYVKGLLEVMAATPARKFSDVSRRLSPNTVSIYFKAFSHAMSIAVRNDIIPSNPCDRLAREEKPKISARDRQYLTREELSRLASTDCRLPEVKRAFMFSCFCGLRFSDVRNLKWDDLYTSYGRTYIHIRIIKTRTPITIPLSPLALSWLPERGRGSVFSLPSVPAVCDNLALWVKDAGIKKHITFHCARHTFATMSISAGVDLFAVSKLLGHTDIKTTQIYAKMMDERKTEAVDALAGFYEGKEEGQMPSPSSEQH